MCCLRITGAVLVSVLALATGCASGAGRGPADEGRGLEQRSGTPAQASPPAPDAATVALLRLADEALARGDLDQAETRYRRAALSDPGAAAWVGLARVALAHGDLSAARDAVARGTERAPGDPDALVVLARVELALARPVRARTLLDRALLARPTHLEAHGLREAMTGNGPARAPANLDEALRRTQLHPYDPRARLAAARFLLAAERREEAVAQLERALLLGDRGAEAAFAAGRLLGQLDPAWAGRRLVPVHCWADETLRAHAGWRMRLRLLWRGASESLLPVLDTVFVPVAMRPFSSAATGPSLEAIQVAFASAARPRPASGILAGFTEREPPRRSRQRRLGQAEYLGRQLLVRLEPRPASSRVLLHELLHLYGGIHVADDLPSIMNRQGKTLTLDSGNARIVTLTAGRRFLGGGPNRNVLPYADRDALIAAFSAALARNLELRRLGIQEALGSRSESRYLAARQAREAAVLDDHLADVSLFLATWLLGEGRRAEAAHLLDVAASLYGRDTQRGRAAARQARALGGG